MRQKRRKYHAADRRGGAGLHRRHVRRDLFDPGPAFLLFDRGEHPPKIVLYLGKVLPPAIIAMLIVYCMKGVAFSTPAGWVPTLLAGAAAVLLHLWKGNDLISIFGATGLYMILVQGVFA